MKTPKNSWPLVPLATYLKPKMVNCPSQTSTRLKRAAGNQTSTIRPTNAHAHTLASRRYSKTSFAASMIHNFARKEKLRDYPMTEFTFRFALLAKMNMSCDIHYRKNIFGVESSSIKFACLATNGSWFTCSRLFFHNCLHLRLQNAERQPNRRSEVFAPVFSSTIKFH